MGEFGRAITWGAGVYIGILLVVVGAPMALCAGCIFVVGGIGAAGTAVEESRTRDQQRDAVQPTPHVAIVPAATEVPEPDRETAQAASAAVELPIERVPQLPAEELSAADAEAIAFVREHYAALQKFRGSESFREFGFGRGGPHYRWLEELEEVRKEDQQYGPEVRLALGELLSLGLACINDPDATRPELEAFLAEHPAPAAERDDSKRLRTWTSASGSFTTQAEFRGMAGSSVRLRKADGTTITVPLAQLSEADRQWIDERAKATR